MVHHSGGSLDRVTDGARIRLRRDGRVDHDVPVVRQLLSPRGAGQDLLDAPERSAPAEGDHRDGQPAGRAQARHELRFLDDDDAPARRERDELFPHHRAAAPLECLLAGIDLVRAVDAEVERGRFLQRGEGQPELATQRRGSLGRRYAAHPHPAAREGLQRRRGATAGAVPERHAVLHQGSGGLTRCASLRVGAHSPTMRRPSRATPPMSSMSAGLRENRERVSATATAMPISDSPVS